MPHHTCTECQQPIPAGRAVLRSVFFERVAWHRDCYEAVYGLVPARREHFDRIGAMA